MRRRQSIRGSLVCVLLTSLSACGLPTDGEARVINDGEVPYHLLETNTVPSGSADDVTPSALDPIVFWLNDRDALVPVPADASCAAGDETLVKQLLAQLAAGPTEERREAGDSTTIPPESTLRLLELDGTTALVEVESDPHLSAERLPLAVGQIVLTVSSSPDVEEVVLVIDGEPVQLPLPGGALTPPPVGPSDYAALVPLRYRDSAPFAPRDAECRS